MKFPSVLHQMALIMGMTLSLVLHPVFQKLTM